MNQSGSARAIDGRSADRVAVPGVAVTAVKVGLAAGLCWLAWEIISNTMADTYAGSNPRAALAWDGGNAAALVELGWHELESVTDSSGSDPASEAGRLALLEDPLASGALGVLAFAADRAGRNEDADQFMRLAASRSLRDRRVQGWLLNRALLARQYAEALRHADAVLRAMPGLFDALLPVLAAIADDRDARIALVELLAHNPPWRARFLEHLPERSANPSALYGVYAPLMAAEPPPGAREYGSLLHRLISTGDHALAYAVQVDFLPPERIAMLGLVNNGGFDHPASGLPFDWTISDVRGARTEIVVDDNFNRFLRVEFHGARVPFRHVSQTLLLQSGSYGLFGKVKSAGLRNARGLQWTITCAEGSRELLLATERVAGTMPWTHFNSSFDVPDREDCRAQEIRLVLAARIAAEQEVSGTIEFDSLRIEREEADRSASTSTRDAEN
jgi:hypothetical protein